MKKYILLVLAFLFSFQVFASSKSIVVYYSLTGTTEKLALRIAEETGSDVFELELVNPYSKNGNTCSDESRKDFKNGVRRELKALPDLSAYDTVYIGTPVWNNSLSNPVETFIFLFKDELKSKTVVPFCTYWSTGNTETLSTIEKLCTSENVISGLSQAHGEVCDVKSFLKKAGLK